MVRIATEEDSGMIQPTKMAATGRRVSPPMAPLARGETVEAILDDYPELDADDVRACLAYAHAALADETIDAVRVTSARGFARPN